MQQQAIKFCEWCQSMFIPTREVGRPQRFCCKPCKLRWASAHRWDGRVPKTGNCEVCGEVIFTQHGTKVCAACRPDEVARKRREYWRNGYGKISYQRHKHKWRVYNANRVNRVKAATSPHTTEAKILARLAYFGHRCWVCGGEGVERDHVKPLSKGGAHLPCNIRPICVFCNRSKKDAWPYPLDREVHTCR